MVVFEEFIIKRVAGGGLFNSNDIGVAACGNMLNLHTAEW